jgi:lysophospholipase L1-like esterase
MARLLFTALLSCALILSAAPKRDGLGRTFEKLRAEGKLTVGYLGGSITAGSGASKPDASYRALTTIWLRDQFPTAEVTEINAAIGGTGSDLGAFRCQRDLLSGKPDLVFIEFAVNDGATPEARVLRSMEGIVRQIWRANSETEIVFIYAMHRTAMAAIYDRGQIPPAVAWHERVAEAYGIPSINVGEALWKVEHDGLASWADLLPDNVHPSDRGYGIYARTIAAFLDERRNDKVRRPHSDLPRAVSAGPFDQARLVDASELTADGWMRDDPAVGKRFPHSIASEKAGTELKYRFSGSAVGVYWLVAADSGDVEWSIDGGAPQRLSSWDKYALKFSRVNYQVLNDRLPPGGHELRVKVLGQKNELSTGNWVRIGALLVN